MSALALPRPLTLEDAIAAGLRAAEDGEAVAEIAARLWSQGLDGEAVDACGVVGLRDLIHARLAQQRHPPQEDEAADIVAGVATSVGRPVLPIHYARQWQRLLRANYEAADGSRKALLSFTLEDAKYLRSLANARADGYLRLRDAMDSAIALLPKHRKSTIGELPEKAQQKIAEALA